MNGMRTWRHGRRHSAAILFGCCLLLAHSLPGEASNDLDRFDLRKRPHGRDEISATEHHASVRSRWSTDIDRTPSSQSGWRRAVRLSVRQDRAASLEEQTFEPDGTVASRKLFGYGVDDQGRPSAQVAVTDQGLFAQVEFSFYDRRGLLSEEIMVTAQGVAEKSLFDVRGHLIYHSRYYQGRLVLEATHHYDTVDRLKESRFYGSDGDPMRTDRYRYDLGRRIEQSSDYFRQPRLRKSVVTYEFDHIGNWIQETVQRWSVKHGAMTTTETLVSRERMITYY